MKTPQHQSRSSGSTSKKMALLIGALAVSAAATQASTDYGPAIWTPAAFPSPPPPPQASTDYGPAIWTPAYSGHWYTTGSGHKFCVIHDMEGYYPSTISYFQQSGTGASIHYCVNGKKDSSGDAPAGE